ncbi:MAG: inorganic diphosphatase [Planctomycetes bacterium]|nr:inorganic diphosphatase [Planctomycetota bacterium]
MRLAWSLALPVLFACSPPPPASSVPSTPAAIGSIAAGAVQLDALTIRGPSHYVTGYEATLPDGRVNAVIEIPTGTNAKWEVDKSDGSLRWEIKNGKPRVVQFLGYPGNYGMIPRTLLAAEEGGDGDPLDVIVLGEPLPRGTVIPVRLVAVLRLLDGGETDDKLVAVRDHTPFATVRDLDDLRARFPGVTEQLEGWFTSYKGPGEIVANGFADAAAAMQVLRSAHETFERTSH